MIHPIHVLGSPALRTVCEDVEADSPEFQQLVDDMLETMYAAQGIGLAAPQIGRTERLFVVDVSHMEQDIRDAGGEMPPQPMVFVNADLAEASESETDFEEGCLSIPDVHETVIRPERIHLRYRDRSFKEHTEQFNGILARVIQHEYDHVDGVLFVDHLSGLRRRLLRRTLADIREGRVSASYSLYADGVGLIEADPDA
ncbi:MAG: peptide deformylase [Bacteroidetes bacterium CG12_big_fil_rev_8_21_14_0_65_60_17]|nr:MAG: peptide deformylase [Bacteroidetes bacterium CG12_big_fil_rev_8_21_14_0_65_60_17]